MSVYVLYVYALPWQQYREEEACMKRRCVPLRGDHNLLTPDIHTLSGVRRCPVIQVRLEGAASHTRRLSDSSSSKSAEGSTRQSPVASPTRRLRFEDETETEAESRYQERQQQRRWAGQRGTGVLASRLNLCVGGRVEPPVDREWSLCQPHVNLRTEPIRETYIGSVTPPDKPPWEGGGAERARTAQKSRSNQGTPTMDLPINPYAPDQLITPAFVCSSPSSPPPVVSMMTSQSLRLNGSEDEQDLIHEHQVEPLTQLRSGAELGDQSPCVEVEEGGGTGQMKNSSSSSETSSTATAESPAPPIPESNGDGQVNQPIRTKLHTLGPEQLISRDEPSRLSLRRLLSTVRLNRPRAGSLDRQSIKSRLSTSDHAPSCLLKKCPSSQSLTEHKPPFVQLRKVLSFQSLVSQQKKRDCSADDRPAADT